MAELNGKKLTGRIAAERIRMTSTPKPPNGAVERYIALGECTSLISDVMDELGIAEGAIGAHVLKPTLPGKMVVGPALTVRNIRRRDDPRVAAKQNKNGMAEFEAHNLAEDGDVLVISGVSGVSNMGGISAYTAQRQGERRPGRRRRGSDDRRDADAARDQRSGRAAGGPGAEPGAVDPPGRGGGGAIVAAASSHLGEGDHRIRPKERRLGRTTPNHSRLSRAAGS